MVRPFERQNMLLRLADLVEKNFEELSQLDTLDMGAPISRTCGNKLRCSACCAITRELGGKSPNIVFADADLDAAVPGAAMAVFANWGQICSAGTRLFVESKIYDEFVGRVAEFGKKLQVGNGIDPNTQIGPLVSEQQMERVSGYLHRPTLRGKLATRTPLRSCATRRRPAGHRGRH